MIEEREIRIMKKMKKDSGVVTLEASIMMPMMILLMLMLNGLFVMFMGQQVVTHAVVQSAKSMSYDPYLVDRINNSDQESLMTLFGDLFSELSTIGTIDMVSTRSWHADEASRLKTVAKERFYGFLDRTESSAEKTLDALGITNLSFSGCSVEDECVLNFQISYKQEYMFTLGDLGKIDRTIGVKVKLFRYNELP